MPKVSDNIVRNVHSDLKASSSSKKLDTEFKKDEESQEVDTGTGEQKQEASNASTEGTVDPEQKEQQDQVARSVGWLEWLSMTKITSDTSQEAAKSTPAKEDPLPTSPPAEPAPPKIESENREASASDETHKTGPSLTPKENQTPQARSWLQLWGGPNTVSQATRPQEPTSGPQDMKDNTAPPRSNGLEENTNSSQLEDTVPTSQPTEHKTHERAGSVSAWLFWPRTQLEVDSTAKKEEQSTENDVLPDRNSGEQPKAPTMAADSQGVSTPKNGRVKASTAASQPTASTETSTPSVPKEPPLQPANVPAPSPPKKGEHAPPNQVLPSFQTSFPLESRPGIIEQLSRLLYKKGSEPKHVLRSQTTPQIKKAIAIGVHGYFPTPLIRTVIGQPTGTSVKFATMAARAIEEWADENNSPCHIEKIALEGEGRISERVDLLWKLLLNWIEHIREADFVLISCHSQGVPVATMLVSKLIAFGCVSSARIGICAMAGINLGPFGDYRSRWISGSAGELFDFADAESKVSQDYRTALKAVLEFGVKVTYVGSIDDQLVSMESSTFSTISHPHVYRAVFVDGRVHAPSFLSHLVGFTMKLRNLGVSDHGLIRELSSPLAGSLYTGEGHSRLYDDKNVYKLAIRFALETTQINSAAIQFHKTSAPTASTTTSNPYILPFAMRGVLEEERNKV
ncbi:Alpha/Beta hydrolase fold [Arthroderma uncinatum]|uniref:Alpha/Beta hydrolase fold n=1 Tax=Arthroderma uncinatum TaxID=74035 RepID=UPI00144A5909|nr:Alpha/Beta hydrolase fold [Arthroderma uncinatum]KAF3483481.1 Alpha/Beta hydrolase fold [Arthroderma uncinatum]